jgi:hypothetical protein
VQWWIDRQHQERDDADESVKQFWEQLTGLFTITQFMLRAIS